MVADNIQYIDAVVLIDEDGSFWLNHTFAPFFEIE